jgi:hypothetical protein
LSRVYDAVDRTEEEGSHVPYLRPAPYNEISYRRIFAALNRYTRETLNPSRMLHGSRGNAR